MFKGLTATRFYDNFQVNSFHTRQSYKKYRKCFSVRDVLLPTKVNSVEEVNLFPFEEDRRLQGNSD